MTDPHFILELLKIVAAMAVPYIALLRTRADLDRFAASQRAKQTGLPFESQMRRRWYHRVVIKRRKPDDKEAS